MVFNVSANNNGYLDQRERAFDKEAIRLVELMPKWIPAEEDGRKIPSWVNLPIKFYLN